MDRLLVVTEAGTPSKQPSGDRLRRSTVDNAIIAVAFLVVGFAAPLLWHNGVSAWLAAPAILVVPGWWLLKALGLSRTFKSVGDVALMVVSSMAIMSAGAGLMLWAHFWHPRAFATAVLAGALVSAARDCIKRPPLWRVLLLNVRRSTEPSTFVAIGFLAVASALWIDAARSLDLARAGTYGLLGIAPLTWYLAVGVFAGTAVWLITSRREQPFLAFVAIAALVVAVFALVPLHTEEPLYAWSYKHIGVARYLNSAGHTDPSADIYNRWPTFFGWSALVSDFLRIDIMTLARWAEPLFVGLHCLLVFGLAKTLSGSTRVGSLSTLFFLVSNWVGQDYFAPQPAAYAMYLGVMQLLCNTMVRTSRSPLLGLMSLVDRKLSVHPLPVLTAVKSTAVSQLVLAGCLDAVLVTSHQLTPYLLVLQIGALTISGYLRKGVLITAVAATLALAYLAPNYQFVESKYGLVSGLNLVDNVKVTAGDGAYRAPLAGHLGAYLSYAVALFMILGFVQLLRCGQRQLACLLMAMGAAPFIMLVAQNYGGEGSLRVYLFSSPWRDIIIAAAVFSVHERWQRSSAYLVTAALLPLFTAVVYVNLAMSVFPRDVVHASEYFYAHAPARSELMLAGKNFPTWTGERYRLMWGQMGDASPNILDLPRYEKRVPRPTDVGRLADELRAESPHPFLVFSSSQKKYAKYYGPTPRNWNTDLERAVDASAEYKVWYSSEHVRIYKVTPAS